MKKLVTGLFIFVFASLPAFAGDLFLSAGAGLGKSLNEAVIGIRYQRETSRLFDLPSHYEAAFMYWTNSSRAQGLAFSRSLVWKNREFRSLDASFGFMGVSRKTDHLGTSLQFYFRLAYAFGVDGRKFSLDLIHISNGKLLFGWDGPNSGENFITVSVGLF